MTTVCLCMIVRDEAEVIGRCLESCRDHIDYWVICDTGSLDGTPEVVERGLAGIPGELHHDQWQDFAHNRSLCMQRAHGKADYLLLMDADWTLEIEPGAFEGLSADSYLVLRAGDSELLNKYLVSGSIPWRFEGVVHEYITSEQERTTERLNGVALHAWSVGGERTGRWERDKQLLLGAVAKDPGDSRSTFYLANPYRDLGEHRAAIEWYDRRAQMDGWDEEIFFSHHQAGCLRAELGDWPGAMLSFIAAFESRPTRVEPLYELASRLRIRGEYETAHLFAVRGLDRPAPPDLLFVNQWIYRYGMLFEFSITAYWTGHVQDALRACDRLLRLAELPDNYRQQTQANRKFCVDRIAQIQIERAAAARAKSPARPAKRSGSSSTSSSTRSRRR